MDDASPWLQSNVLMCKMLSCEGDPKIHQLTVDRLGAVTCSEFLDNLGTLARSELGMGDGITLDDPAYSESMLRFAGIGDPALWLRCPDRVRDLTESTQPVATPNASPKSVAPTPAAPASKSGPAVPATPAAPASKSGPAVPPPPMTCQPPLTLDSTTHSCVCPSGTMLKQGTCVTQVDYSPCPAGQGRVYPSGDCVDQHTCMFGMGRMWSSGANTFCFPSDLPWAEQNSAINGQA